MQDQINIEELVNELFCNAPKFIPRKMFSEITGKTISVKYLANLDSEGVGIKPRIRIGNKVCYPKDAAKIWFTNRCKAEGEAK